MSFAPKTLKKTNKNSLRQSAQPMFQSPPQSSESAHPFLARLEQIQQTLETLSLPSINALKTALSSAQTLPPQNISLLQRNQTLQQRITSCQYSINELSIYMQSQFSLQRGQSAQASLHSQYVKQMKIIQAHVNALESNLKDVELQLVQVGKNVNGQQEQNMKNKQVETMVDKMKKEIEERLSEVKFQVQQRVARFANIENLMQKLNIAPAKINNSSISNFYSESANTDGQTKMLKTEELEERFGHLINDVKTNYQKQVKNIQKDIGTLRSQLETVQLKEQEKQIQEFINNLPENMNDLIKQFTIESYHEELIINELEKFNSENSIRIITELNSCEEKLNQLQKDLEAQNNNKDQMEALLQELTFLNQKEEILKYQIEGLKMKFLMVMKTIGDKMEKISSLKDDIENAQAEEALEVQNDLFDNYENLEIQVKDLMESISGSLENVTEKFLNVEAIISQLDTIYQKK